MVKIPKIAKKNIPEFMAETKINILLKKPTNGGTPDIENSSTEKDIANSLFECAIPDKSFRNFNLLAFLEFINESKIINILRVINM